MMYAAVLTFLCVGLVAMRAGTASAATPIPTASPTPAVTPTPSPDQVSTFIGSCWLNAQLCLGQTMTAKVGDKVCAVDSSPIAPPDSVNRLLFTLRVPSTQVVPGCGSEGAQVTFFVGDHQITQTGVWHGGTQQFMYFTAGYPFARFDGSLSKQQAPGLQLVPFVGATRCGFGYWGVSGYEADVLSASQQPGCGTEGASVTFKLLDAQGNVIAVAPQTGIWHLWDSVSQPQQLDLTFAPVGGSGTGLPSVGTGDGSSEGLPWAGLALLVASLGFVATAFGLALRRH